MINDIEALGAPGALEAVAGSDCAVCLDAHAGRPGDHAGRSALRRRGRRGARLSARSASPPARRPASRADRIVVDPGFGFGKTVEHNLDLLRRLPEFAALGVPLLAGWSRKSIARRITGRDRRRAPGGEPARPLCSRSSGWGENTARARREGNAGRGRWCWQALEEGMSRKYFGTDGVRGTVGEAPDHAGFRAAPGLCRRPGARRARSADARQRAPRRADRQGHAHLRLHARGGAGGGLLRRRRRRAALRAAADAGRRLPDARAAPRRRAS